MLSISFHNPDYPDEIVFDIGGIAVPNNGTKELDAEAELAFFARHGEKVKEFYKDTPYVSVSGTSELKSKDYEPYNVSDDEVSTETIIEEGEVDPTVPEVNEEVEA